MSGIIAPSAPEDPKKLVEGNETRIGIRADAIVDEQPVAIVAEIGKNIFVQLDKAATLGTPMSFAYWLKDKGTLPVKEALVFQSGSDKWTEFDSWPPREAHRRNLYFREDGKLSFEAPPTESAEAFDSYVSDPAHPVPYRNRPVDMTYPKDHRGSWYEWLVQDQRFVDQPDHGDSAFVGDSKPGPSHHGGFGPFRTAFMLGRTFQAREAVDQSNPRASRLRRGLVVEIEVAGDPLFHFPVRIDERSRGGEQAKSF